MPPPMHMVTMPRLALRRAALDQNVAGHARPAHAVGMADGDRAAVDIEALLRNAEPVAAIKRLARERLVQFPRSMSFIVSP